MGLVEVCGTVEASIELYSPLSNMPCVLFHYKIEEYRRSGKHGYWATIDYGNSFECPFWLDDGTGKVLVYPACKGLGLTQLEELGEKWPEVAACLKEGLWTTEAEKKLLKTVARDS